MKYLTPEIQVLSNNKYSVSLVRHNVSCGIFQEYCNNERPKLNFQEKIENNK